MPRALLPLLCLCAVSLAGWAVDADRFVLSDPDPVAWRLEATAAGQRQVSGEWLTARRANGLGPPVQFGRRVVLALAPGAPLEAILAGGALRHARTVGPQWFILEAADARLALSESARLGALPGVLRCRPVVRRALRRHGPYAAPPNDPRFGEQWNFENRAGDGTSLGIDLNARAAWTVSRGAGVVIAVVDDGVELGHPEFVTASAHTLHFNFTNGTTNGLPSSVADTHATAVAGLAAARGGNRRGISGLAPLAGVASWKIFTGDSLLASDEAMMDMFQHHTDAVAVQNHSWGNSGSQPIAPTDLEALGLSNALTAGRGGRGVIMVRSGGNGRELQENTNDDGYANDPRVIAVASVDADGRAADYSTPGACLLVAAAGGTSNRALLMTDRPGSGGYNTVGTGDAADYVSSTLVVGTSFSAPQIAGLSALLLSARPDLAMRDVQQLVLLAARHVDLEDPDLQTNAAGLRVSHNVGFGIPDAGQALALALVWPTLPPAVRRTYSWTGADAIPDDQLRVLVTGANIPVALSAIPSTPGNGLHPVNGTLALALVDLGYATNDITQDLTGRIALVQRGPTGSFPDNRNTFQRKVERAASAGALAVIVYNHTGTTERLVMGGLDFAPIPAVLIGQDAGLALKNHLATDPTTHVQLRYTPITRSFSVPDTLRCEHVSLQVRTTHPRRGDIRITVVSPSGTRSVLQRVNADTEPGPVDWSYSSVLHFGESTAGVWTVEVGDEAAGLTGNLLGLELRLDGVPLVDTDHDGLDDAWELAALGSLGSGPADDPDHDGYGNAVEQLLHTAPDAPANAFAVDYSVFNTAYGRLSWPGLPSRVYEVQSAETVAGPYTHYADVVAAFPVTERFVPEAGTIGRFFRVRLRP